MFKLKRANVVTVTAGLLDLGCGREHQVACGGGLI